MPFLYALQPGAKFKGPNNGLYCHLGPFFGQDHHHSVNSN